MAGEWSTLLLRKAGVLLIDRVRCELTKEEIAKIAGDNVSILSTRDKNVSMYLDFIDTLCGRVHGLNTNLPIEMVAIVHRFVCWPNTRELGHGG